MAIIDKMAMVLALGACVGGRRCIVPATGMRVSDDGRAFMAVPFGWAVLAEVRVLSWHSRRSR